jgi:hypothetical protein
MHNGKKANKQENKPTALLPHLSRMKENAEFITATRVSSGMYTGGGTQISI